MKRSEKSYRILKVRVSASILGDNYDLSAFHSDVSRIILTHLPLVLKGRKVDVDTIMVTDRYEAQGPTK
jgi:hypothetical protein